jgi:hypothetical protein
MRQKQEDDCEAEESEATLHVVPQLGFARLHRKQRRHARGVASQLSGYSLATGGEGRQDPTEILPEDLPEKVREQWRAREPSNARRGVEIRNPPLKSSTLPGSPSKSTPIAPFPRIAAGRR